MDEKFEDIEKIASIIKAALLENKKLLFCGNGSSASQSEHLACEFVARFQKERKALDAISLCSNNSTLTAISNDYSFDDVFKRQIEALVQEGDILIALTTSAKSKNVIKAIQKAKDKNLKVILFIGKNKSNLDVDFELNAPSDITAQIQEMHLIAGHIICEIIEFSF